jgi:hypothetical protein
MSTLASLLHPAYELAWAPGEEIADGAQLVDCQWWHPQFGCDSLQYVVDNARQALAPGVASPGGADPITQQSPMSDTLPPVPLGSTIRKNADGSWSYRDGPHTWRPMPAPQTAAPWATPSAASIPTERLDAQSLAVQLEEDGRYLLASAMANECPKTRDLAVRVIRAAYLLAGGWGGEQ